MRRARVFSPEVSPMRRSVLLLPLLCGPFLLGCDSSGGGTSPDGSAPDGGTTLDGGACPTGGNGRLLVTVAAPSGVTLSPPLRVSGGGLTAPMAVTAGT